MKKIFLYSLTVCAVLPLIALPLVIAQVRIRGYDQWEAIFLGLGMVLPIVVLALMGYIFMLERFK